MSRTAKGWVARRLAAGDAGDRGFTLIEVIVALTLFALAASAGAAMLINTMRAGFVAKLDTGAKTLTQERFEAMRNLPFHVDYDVNGTGVTNKSDLLDYYFPNLTAAGAISGSTIPAGYVTAAQTGASYRLNSEPATGPFYRTVISPVPGFNKYTQYVAMQFVDKNRTPVTPPGTFNTQVSGSDFPPSSLVRAVVTTKWTAGTMTHQMAISTLIADARPSTPLVTLQGQITAAKIVSGLPNGSDLTVGLGDVTMNGALSSSVAASANTLAGYAQISPGARVDGAKQQLSSPPNATVAAASAGPQTLLDVSTSGSPLVACFGGTSSTNASVSTSTGQPLVASSSAPLTTTAAGSGCSTYGLQFSNEPAPVSRLLIDPTQPVVSVPGNGATTLASSTGWLASTAGAGHVAKVTATASTGTLQILPTSFAPNGIVQVSLTSATLTCQTGGTAASVASVPTYTAVVRYWKYSAAGSGYQTLSVAGTQSTDPLAAVSLATDGSGIQVGVDANGQPLWLGDYIKSWGSATAASTASFAKVDPDYKSLRGSTAGLVTVTTAPTRSSDSASAVAVQLGAMSCQAEDNR